MESISGLGRMEFRIDQLEASLKTHISSLNAANPLISLTNQYFLSHDKNSILQSSQSSSLFSKWILYKKKRKIPLEI
jgi:hypothetical protein